MSLCLFIWIHMLFILVGILYGYTYSILLFAASLNVCRSLCMPICVRIQCLYPCTETLSTLNSILVDVKHIRFTCIRTAISTYLLDGMFFCHLTSFPIPFYVYTYSFSFCSIWERRDGMAGVFHSFIRLSIIMSVYSQCTQHFMLYVQILFIYCNLVARHFVNVYDIFTFIKKLWNTFIINVDTSARAHTHTGQHILDLYIWSGPLNITSLCGMPFCWIMSPSK